MAVTPLFVSDLDLLKSRLRLSGAQEGDATKVIEQAVLDARVEFYERLGAARVDAIVAFTPSDTPSTDDELTRTLAESTEVLMVRVETMRVLPQMFLDSAGSARKAWNEEGITRDAGRFDTRRYIKEMTSRIRQNMERLGSGVKRSEVQGGALGPDEDQILRPFDTIQGAAS